MSPRTPADPPLFAGKKVLRTGVSPADYGVAEEPAGVASSEQSVVEPRRSFFRGVAVGLAIMIPIWVWVIIRLLR